MADLDLLNFGSNLDGDKIVEILEGTLTYSYTTADSGGYMQRENPQPGTLFLPFSIYSVNGGVTWFGDMEGDFINQLPDMMTGVTTSYINYRWNSYGPGGSFPVMYKTALLAMDV